MTTVSLSDVTPVVPARDVAAAIAFFVEKLGFMEMFRQGEPVAYAGVVRDAVSVHIFQCDEPRIAEWTAFRIRVTGVEALYDAAWAAGIVHPNGSLACKPWGSREFVVLEPGGVAVTFWEPAGSQR